MFNVQRSKSSPASAGATVCADETAFLIDKGFLATVGAHLTFGCRAVLNILLQCTLHAVLPRIDSFIVERELTDKTDDMVERHTITKHSGEQLGIVPIFGVELLR